MGTSRNMAEWIQAQMARDPALAEAISKEELNVWIAQQVHHFRKQADLSQKQLAEKSGTKQSVISRIEDDDYDGHSLTLLHKIAWALSLKLNVTFSKETPIRVLSGSSPVKTISFAPSIPSLTTNSTMLMGISPITFVGSYQIASGSNIVTTDRARS